MIQTLKAKVLKGIDNTLKPAGECSYYSLLGGLKLLKKEKSVDKHHRKRIKRIFEEHRASLKNCPELSYALIIAKINEEIQEHGVQVYVYKESTKCNIVRVLDSQTRTCKYTKNYVSFVERVYAPQVQNKDVKPIYLYLRKVDKHGEIECTFIKNMRAMQTILSTDNKTAVTTSKVPHYCHKCLSGFITQHSYNDHMLYCAGPNVEAHLFKKEGHFKFDKHSCVDAPPFMFFDVETRLVHESESLSTMYLVSYAIGVVFNDGIDLPMFSLYRSSHQTYRELHTFNIPSVIKQAILHDDKKKCRQLAASIVGKKPYAINEQLFNDIFSIASACRNVLYKFYLPKNRDLSFSAQNRFMKSVNSGDKCVLCDIPVDLCLTESLDRNRAVLEARSYEIYRLVCERRTSRGVYE